MLCPWADAGLFDADLFHSMGWPWLAFALILHVVMGNQQYQISWGRCLIAPLRSGTHAMLLGTQHLLGVEEGGAGSSPPILCLVFGKASGHGTVIPAVNTDFTGLLIGTIWQRGASHPLQSRCFPVPESHHQLSERLSASSGLLGGPVRWSW